MTPVLDALQSSEPPGISTIQDDLGMQEQVVPAQVLLEHAHFEFLRTIPVQDGRQQQGLLIWPMRLVGTELDRPLRWMPPCLAGSVHLDVEVPLPDQLPRSGRVEFLEAHFDEGPPHGLDSTTEDLNRCTTEFKRRRGLQEPLPDECSMEEDLVARYAAEAAAAMAEEAARRRAELIDPAEEAILRNLRLESLIGGDRMVPALLARLGDVRAALDGHGGGILVTSCATTSGGLDLVLDLSGACLACGAAPGTLKAIRFDLEADPEIHNVRFSSALLDTFDDLGREFILAHGEVEFVDA